MKPYSEENKFWHSIWLSQGKPRFGDIYNNMRLSRLQYKYAVRRLKRCNDRIQTEKFISGIFENGRNIFDEIRKFRGIRKATSTSIDGEVGAKNIAEHFALKYRGLYNNVKNGHTLDEMRSKLEMGAMMNHEAIIAKVNAGLIDQAIKKLKPNKRDALFDTVSDCYVKGPTNLREHISNLVRMFLIHGSVPNFILLCTLLPIVKDGLGDITNSDNYRAIAGGCLLLKILDLVILLLEGDKLEFSELQFAYQSATSTTVCSWCATTVIDYFNRNGSPVYGAAMDMSKAFDMVEWVALFDRLIEKKLNCIILRLMLYIYEHQSCSVKWSGHMSSQFSVGNGVRQGAVSSELLVTLKASRLGCHIDGVFLGTFIFADDILLLSASLPGLQSLVDKCQTFASRRNLKFGTSPNPLKSKTKCIVFSKRAKDRVNLAPIKLDGQVLPWVEKVNHLGCILEQDNSMKMDIAAKRGQFIGKINSLLQEFHFVDSTTLIKLVDTFAMTFYGSSLWNLRSRECERLYNTWNVTVRRILNVDRKTHRYLIEPLSQHSHVKTLLMSRYIRFYRGLLNSQKFTVRFLARLVERDHRTVMGTTLGYIAKQCAVKSTELDRLSPHGVKRCMTFESIPPDQIWVPQLAKELLSTRDSILTIQGFSDEEVDTMLKFSCTC